LTSSALFLDAATVESGDAKAFAPVARVLDRLHGPVILSTRERGLPLRRSTKVLEVGKPNAGERRRVWQELLGTADAQVNGQLGNVVSQFNLSVPAIRAAVTTALESGGEGADLLQALWDASRMQARIGIDNLAQRIDTVAQWAD